MSLYTMHTHNINRYTLTQYLTIVYFVFSTYLNPTQYIFQVPLMQMPVIMTNIFYIIERFIKYVLIIIFTKY